MPKFTVTLSRAEVEDLERHAERVGLTFEQALKRRVVGAFAFDEARRQRRRKAEKTRRRKNAKPRTVTYWVTGPALPHSGRFKDQTERGAAFQPTLSTAAGYLQDVARSIHGTGRLGWRGDVLQKLKDFGAGWESEPGCTEIVLAEVDDSGPRFVIGGEIPDEAPPLSTF